MFNLLWFRILEFFLQLIISMALGSFFYNEFSYIYLRLKGEPWSTTMPEMLKEDKIISIINLLVASILLILTIVINVLYKPLIGFYLVVFFLLLVGSSVVFPPKGRKIAENCYVMIYHIDHFIVTLNGRRIYIQGERLRGNPDQIIYKENSPQWLPPHEKEPVSEKDYEYMLQSIIKFLEKIKKQGVIK